MKKIFALILSCCLVFSSNIGVFADNIEHLEKTENQNEQKIQDKGSVVTYVSLSNTYVKKNDPMKIVVGLSEDSKIKSADLVLYNEELQKEYTVNGNMTDEGNLYFETSSLDEGTYILKSFKYVDDDQEEKIDFDQLEISAKFGIETEIDNIDADAYVVDDSESDEMSTDNVSNNEIATDNGESIEDALKIATQESNLSNNLFKASSKVVVVLDPGHGGYDGGATKSYGGKNYVEKDLNLKIAQYCKAELEKYENVQVYMTRDNDAYVGLEDRVAKARNWGATVFVSIHNNSSSSSRVHGATVYYPNSSLNANIGAQGGQLASNILNQLVVLGLANNGTRIRNSESGDTYADGSICDYYSVIRNSKKSGFPGIIVEHAFISNSSDASNYLGSDEALKRLGVADAQGIVKYFGLTKAKPGTVFNGVNYELVFDPEYYMNKYPDVRSAVNGDPQTALQNFAECGISQGRQGREEFDVNYYKTHNVDLQNCFGNNWYGYYYHFLNYGVNEGRTTSEKFDVISYRARYSDLQNCFKNDYKSYLIHYIQHGKAEGRNAEPTVYNVKFLDNGNLVKEEKVVCGRNATAPQLIKTGYSLEWDKTYNSVVEDMVINANWKLAQYKVTYDAKEGNVNNSTKTVTYSEKYGELERPTRKGYTFAGWYTLPEGGTLITKDTVVNSTSDHTIYAHWNANDYNVTYDPNGGTVEQKGKTITFGQTYGELPVPKREGYDFVGWWTETDSGDEVKSDTIVSIDKNHVLYAHWKLQNVSISYNTHVQNIGWQSSVSDGQLSGTIGKNSRLEAIKIGLNTEKKLGLIYTTHVQNDGWHNNSFDNEISGTTGQAKRVEAIMIKLTGEDSDRYDIYYRAHVQNYGWLGWAKNGQPAGTSEYKCRLEAIQILIVEKGTSAPSQQYGGYVCNNSSAYVSRYNDAPTIKTDTTLQYQTHVQNLGWQNTVNNGQISGTTGKGLRLESLKLNLKDQSCSGTIQYKTHVQNLGWQNMVSDGQISGITGRALRVEAINISLTGEMARKYDVYYRVHVQNYGWLSWAKNGENAGTEGLGLRMESMQILLVKKGENKPSNTYNGVVSNYSSAYYKK